MSATLLVGDASHTVVILARVCRYYNCHHSAAVCISLVIFLQCRRSSSVLCSLGKLKVIRTKARQNEKDEGPSGCSSDYDGSGVGMEPVARPDSLTDHRAPDPRPPPEAGPCQRRDSKMGRFGKLVRALRPKQQAKIPTNGQPLGSYLVYGSRHAAPSS